MIEIGLLILASLIMEVVDSSLGMMYGTLLVPVLINLGLDPIYVVPAILISQALGGITGTVSHHKFKNADFKGLTRDTKIGLAMVIPGLLVIILGVFLAVNIPKFWVKFYIADLVIIMSVLTLLPIRYNFAWWKHYIIGMLAAFNKSISGGGFGPVTSTGGILGGLEAKVSIATTTFAEIWICLGAFILYMFLSGVYDLNLIIALSIGATIGGVIGPYISKILNHNILRKFVGWLGIISGCWLLWKIFI